MKFTLAGRLFAACIAAAAWAGLVVQFARSYSATGSTLLAAWGMLAFFTILTNILVAVVFTCIAINCGRALQSDRIIAGTMLSILLVGIVNALLLWGALELAGSSALVDKLHHVVTPALVPIFWIVCVPKGGLSRRHPALWAIYPLAYLVYSMTRGLVTGKYAYPFLNVSALGWQRTGLNAIFIAIAFLISGYALVWIDRQFGDRKASGTSNFKG